MARRTKPRGPSLFDALDEAPGERGAALPEYVDDPRDGEECSQHTFQVLTKRAERVARFAKDLPWPRNVWMGTSVESSRVLARVDCLRRIPAAVRFLSCEPLIGPLDALSLQGIDWVIVGGESGPRARPMQEAWLRGIHAKCLRARVPFFFKQWGGVRKDLTGREFNGTTYSEMPVARSRWARRLGRAAAG